MENEEISRFLRGGMGLGGAGEEYINAKDFFVLIIIIPHFSHFVKYVIF